MPVTARDFVFTHQVRVEHPVVNDLHLKVRRVRAVGAKTVEVVLRAPFADWRLLFDVVLPRHAAAGQEFESLWKDGIDNPRTRRAIGSGPFLLAGWQRGKQMTLVRNPRYWGPHTAYLDRVEFRFFPPQDTADLLRRGEIDMIDPHWNVLQAQALELHRQRAPGIRVDTVLGAVWDHFAIRQGPGGHPALRKRLVRQAIAYGIDRAVIAREAAALNLASAAASRPLDSVVFLANSPYHERNWSTYRHRPARARQLLERAGCRRGADGIYVCDGNRLTLRFTTTAGVPRRELMVRLAQAQLREVGIEVVPVFGPASAVLGSADSLLVRGDFDVLLFSWVQGAVDGRPRGHLRMPAAAELHGLLRSPGHPRPRQRYADPRPHQAREAPEQGRREAGEGRARYPAHSEHVPLRPQDECSGRGSEPLQLRFLEHGELVARGVALAAALAVSLLAVSGAGGADVQTPKRGGTLVSASSPSPRASTHCLRAASGWACLRWRPRREGPRARLRRQP